MLLNVNEVLYIAKLSCIKICCISTEKSVVGEVA